MYLVKPTRNLPKLSVYFWIGNQRYMSHPAIDLWRSSPTIILAKE